MPSWEAHPAVRITGPGEPIRTMWSWFSAAPPEGGDRQWKDGASAKELARSWAASGSVSPPAAMLEALDTEPKLHGFQAWDVVAEAETPLDPFGRGRQHDLIASGAAEGGPTLVTVEAKAKEKFGSRTIGEELAAGLAKPGSKVPERVAEMVAVLPNQAKLALRDGEPLPAPLAGCGYQLLTATVGTIIEAGRRHCSQAVFMVHAFRKPDPTGALKRIYAEADADLDAFSEFVGAGTIAFGQVAGPITSQGTRFAPSGVSLFVGKCLTYLD